MSILRPFPALRPANPENAREISAPPYDVVSYDEAKKIADSSPLSFIHISRPEVGLPKGGDPYSEEVYRRAHENFESFRRQGIYLEESTPSLYLYRLKMGSHEQTGIAGSFSIDEYDQNRIKKHERTRPDKELDRTRHLHALSAQTGPVFLAYSQNQAIDLEVKRIQTTTDPLYHFQTDDGISHTVWQISEPKTLVDLFALQVKALYIADGHHRAAAASQMRKWIREGKHTSRKADAKNAGERGLNSDFVFAVAFPENQLQILPYHRLVRDLGSMTEDELLSKLRKQFEITQGRENAPPQGKFGMYLKSCWYRLHPKNPIQGLDVAYLQDQVLEPILGIQNPRTDPRLDFVGGIRGFKELEKQVDLKNAAVAFELHPVSMRDIMDVADQDQMMPPKSTWFEPKLRDGLLLYPF